MESTSKSSNSDRPPREIESVIGSEEEIQPVLGAVQTETLDAVLFTGGPGFGKTTMAIGSSVYCVTEEKTNGTRLARLIIDRGTYVLRRFLHSCISPPKTLGDVLQTNLRKLQYLKSKREIFDDQWEKLFPSSGDPPDSETFDITLLHLLIRELCNLPVPMTGWHKMPAEDDESLQANITRIKCFRNELCHSHSTGIPNTEFEDKWNKISLSLEAIEVDVYRKRIQSLKNDPIDHDTRRTVEKQVERWRKSQQQDEDELNGELCSYLPDKIPDEGIIGRSKELKQVQEYIQSEAVSVVLITGGPGFGKTTVAKAVAHELAKPENQKTVIFCSLITKKTFTEVATEMIHSCGKIPTQLPEKPDQWLKEWSQQIQKEVTFVVDNADGVLESEDRKSFLRLLCTMRGLSKQKVTFVITSRKTFQDPDLPSKDVRLDPLSPEEANKILISRVNDEEIRKKLCKTQKIVDLCGCVPLALCIVGSLLSDYTEEKLIKHLEQEPMTILQDDGESFQMAIKASFDLLTKAEQDALVVMSIFPGSLDVDAAEAVLRTYSDPGTLPISTLRSLKNKSLVEQTHSRRYQLHPLIRAFAKKISQSNNSQLLVEGEKLACVYFMSRLDENAQRFWGKDTCKAAIDSFSLDRHNFEHFLQVYSKGMEDQDQKIVDGCQKILHDLPQKCMFIEKCIQPQFYVQFLERLLKFSKSVNQPVHEVELLCLLGHEMRKKGETEKYNDNMKKASQLYSENDTEFETNALSQVVYLHSQARFISEANVFGDQRPKNLYHRALKICEKKLPDHPETAATLLFAGRNAKRRKENDEASTNFKQALTLFKERLGDHFMTAQCLKDIADFIWFAEKKDDRLDKSLECYETAMEMMEKLGMNDQKESILTLKNYGVCQMQKGNLREAKKLLEKAELVAERELDKEHRWKVMVYTEQAFLYHKEVNEQDLEASIKEELLDQMEASLKKGLDMCFRLNDGNRDIERLGNKHFIREVLNRYPERFPEKQYPRQ